MSTTTESHDRNPQSGPAEPTPTAEAITLVATEGHLDAHSAQQLIASAASAPPGAAIVADLSGVTQLSLEAAAALLTLTRRCQAEGRTLRITASAPARRKLALLGLESVLPLHSPSCAACDVGSPSSNRPHHPNA
ncbi:STAS domain-containing protein [Amycolatopsis sp. NPDC003865]